jgi:hypothetical protein
MSVAGDVPTKHQSSGRSDMSVEGMSVEGMSDVNKLLQNESGVFNLGSFFYLSSVYSRTDIFINV